MIWADRTMENMTGRMPNSAEDIVRKLRRADELTATGKTQEEITAELEVSVATLLTDAGSTAAWIPTPRTSSRAS